MDEDFTMAHKAFELRLMSPPELRTEVPELRAKLKAVRSALNSLIEILELSYGDEEDALDGVIDADMIHEDLQHIQSLLGPDPDAVEERCSDCDPSFGCFASPSNCSKRVSSEGGGA